MEEYTYTAVWQEDSKNYAARCEEHPNLSWFADTEDKAIEGIKNIIYTVENQFVSFLHAQ